MANGKGLTVAAIIGDGYDWHHQIGERCFVYRPMLSMERRAVVKAMSWLGNDSGFDLANSVILGHVCFGIDKSHVNHIMLSNPEGWMELWLTICGLRGGSDFQKGWEKSTAENLRSGVRLFIKNPKLAARSCESCREFWYDENGDIPTVDGNPAKRIPESPVSCDTPAGCPAGHYLNQLRLTPDNRLAYIHYQRCEATGNFPDDAIVSRNARIIQSAKARK